MMRTGRRLTSLGAAVVAVLSLAVGAGFAQQGDAGDGAGEEAKPKPEAEPKKAIATLRLMTYNIHHGEGTDGKFDLVRLAELIKAQRPDLVAIQEVDVKTKRAGGVDQAAELGRLTGMHYAFGKFMDYSDGDYGQMVLSKFPIKNARNLALPDGPEPRTALAVEVEIPIKPGGEAAASGVSKVGAEKKTAGGAITGASIGGGSKDKKKRTGDPAPEELKRQAEEERRRIEVSREKLLAMTDALAADEGGNLEELRAVLKEALVIEQQFREQIGQVDDAPADVTDEYKAEIIQEANQKLEELGRQIKEQERLVDESREKMLKLFAESGIDLAGAGRAAPATQKLIFVGNHFYATEGERTAQAERLTKHLEPELRAGVPIILAGDFNSTPGSKPMEVLGKHWVDPTADIDRRTWPSDLPRVEIDYILYTPAGRFRCTKSKVVPEKVASDHRPVVTVLNLLADD